METLAIRLPVRYPIPVTWDLSFRPYLDYLEDQIQKTHNSIYKTYLHSIAEILYANPILLKPIEDWSILESYQELVELISLNHALPGDNAQRHAIGIPSPMRFFTYSQSFKESIADEEGNLKLRLQHHVIEEEQTRRIYRDILHACYGMEDFTRTSYQTLLKLTDHGPVYKKYFHFITNNQFVRIRHHGVLPPLQTEWIEYVKGTISSFKDLETTLPLNQFSFEGFLLFTVRDETLEESLHELRETVATMHTLSRKDAFIKMKSNTLSLLEEEGLEVGFLPLIEVNKKILYHRFLDYTSILIRILKKHIPAPSLNSFFENFISGCYFPKDSKIQIYNSIAEADSEIEGLIALEAINTFGIVPVFHQESLVGIVELASMGDEGITPEAIRRIEQAMPMFREFIVYQTDKLHEQMEFFIKRNFSPIQPEIQWKFNEVAWQAIQHPVSMAVPEIVFRQLTPFYGAVDIRNSSIEHHHAIFADATFQLKNMQAILKEKSEHGTDLSFQVAHWLEVLHKEQADDQELELRRFIENATQAIRLKYQDTDLSWKHEAEDKYERSITSINKALKEVLDAQERKLKSSAPVYFDKYRTDGWEYSIYVGQELNPSFLYTPEVITKIKKWEFDTILQMGISAAAIRKGLPVPLETTQLILAQTNPVDIRFRLDEHRFDVEGSYSIRYEVIKKRIDKICISETGERLTQPGKIAIVYLYSYEIEAYLEVIEEYIAQDKISPKVEYLNLEDVQGVMGLKALRVEMKF